MSDEENVRLLKKITTITPHEGTDFIDIIVKHSPREEAIRLANAIAQVGVERGATIQKNRAQRAIDALDEELTNQRMEVANHLNDLKLLMTEYKVPFPSDQKSFPLPKDLPTEPNPDVIDLSIRQHIYIQAKETYEQSQAMLNEMKIKQQETRTLLKMPRTPVTIHKHAQ